MIIISISTVSGNESSQFAPDLSDLYPDQTSCLLEAENPAPLCQALENDYIQALDYLLESSESHLICHEWVSRSFCFFGFRLSIRICRVLDTNTGKTHRVLPDFLIPHSRLTRADVDLALSDSSSSSDLLSRLPLLPKEVSSFRSYLRKMLSLNLLNPSFSLSRPYSVRRFFWGTLKVSLLFPPA